MMLDNSENDSDPIISLGDYAMNPVASFRRFGRVVLKNGYPPR